MWLWISSPSLRCFGCGVEMAEASLTFDPPPPGPGCLSHCAALTNHREQSALHFPAAATLLSLVLCLECRQGIRCHPEWVVDPDPQLDRTPPPRAAGAFPRCLSTLTGAPSSHWLGAYRVPSRSAITFYSQGTQTDGRRWRSALPRVSLRK